MVIALFEYRLRADIDMAEWEQTFARMAALASEMPGCLSIGTPPRMEWIWPSCVSNPKKLYRRGRTILSMSSLRPEAAKRSSMHTR
jgi:hypothetical protein